MLQRSRRIAPLNPGLFWGHVENMLNLPVGIGRPRGSSFGDDAGTSEL